MRKTALELFLVDGSSLIFNFPDGDHEEISSKLIRMRKERCPNLIYHGTLDPRKIIDKSGVTKKWMNHEISNFEYLMYLNAHSSRSYKDMTQYPVFPWIISDYISEVLNMEESKSYRDLSKTMGAMGSDERTRIFIERFENFDQFNPLPNFHFGSHYSSPAIILQFLIRLYPFAAGAKELQNGKFDLPDRLFYAIEESFKGATEEISDVRELIPEFYFLPDFLINKEKLNFGLQQSGQRVHHVMLPKWCKGNPYKFVSTLRIALESESVSRNLHNWIDLIFGYKQKGKEAEKNLNTFFYMTYEDSIDFEKITSPGLKISTEAQVVHFGQCPTQLFLKPHPARYERESVSSYNIIADPHADIRAYRPSNKKATKDLIDRHNLNIYGFQERALLKLMTINDSRIIGFRKNGTITYYRWWNSNLSNNVTPFNCGLEREKIMQIERPKSKLYNSSTFLI